METKPIAILGAGSWGTALGLYLSRRNFPVRIWSIETDEINAMLTEKANNRYLPGYPLPTCFYPTPDFSETLSGVENILIVVPSVGFRETLNALKPYITQNTRIICATKGLDMKTGQLLKEVVEDVLDDMCPFAVLSGPSFAREVAQGLPTAVVIASKNEPFLKDLYQIFNSDIFHIDLSRDVIGVEVGGVVKNVIAIATGISDGMQLGVNTRSAIITRGLNEMMRLGIALGGEKDTFIGLSGLGDLILTCSDDQSRNRRFGLALGKNSDIQQAEAEIGQAIEGKKNAEQVVLLAKQKNVEMPVCETVWDVLRGRISGKEAIGRLVAG